MKRLLIGILILFISCFCHAQEKDPVHWHFSSKKIADKTYELHFTATIDAPWHIYAQESNTSRSQPTAVTFKKSPLADLSGGMKEEGMLKTEEAKGGALRYYEGQVDFVQVVVVRSGAKISVGGQIDYMACEEGRCLAPATKVFAVRVGGK